MKVVRHNEGIRYNNYDKLPDPIKKMIPEPDKYSKSIDITSMFDLAMMETFGLNSEEYDCFCKHSSDEETYTVFDVFNSKDLSFTAKRKALEIIHKYKEMTYATTDTK